MLTDATLTKAKLGGANFTAATLNGVITGSATGAPGVLPSYWEFVNGYLVGPQANLKDANLANATLSFAHLAGANLDGAKLAGANLYGVRSGNITTTPASLPSGWTLVSGYLLGPGRPDWCAAAAGSDMSGADLVYANLDDAVLVNANLTGADLAFAILTGATPRGACSSMRTSTTPNLGGARTCVGRARRRPGGLGNPAPVLGAGEGLPHRAPGEPRERQPGGGEPLTRRAHRRGPRRGEPRASGTQLDRVGGRGRASGLPAGRLEAPEGLLRGAAGEPRAREPDRDEPRAHGPAYANLTRANLTRANLGGSNLVHANLAHGVLVGVTLTGANLGRASLTGVVSSGIKGKPAALPPGWHLVQGRLVHT